MPINYLVLPSGDDRNKVEALADYLSRCSLPNWGDWLPETGTAPEYPDQRDYPNTGTDTGDDDAMEEPKLALSAYPYYIEYTKTEPLFSSRVKGTFPTFDSNRDTDPDHTVYPDTPTRYGTVADSREIIQEFIDNTANYNGGVPYYSEDDFSVTVVKTYEYISPDDAGRLISKALVINEKLETPEAT